MATYNSAVYAQETGQSTTAVGYAAPIPLLSDAKRAGGVKRNIFVAFDTSLQNLAIGDVINVANLPADVIVSAITVITDTALASSTVQVGVTGTAGYYSTSAISTASAGKVDAFTKLANYGTPTSTSGSTTVIATVAGAAWTTGKFYFLIEYLSN